MIIIFTSKLQPKNQAGEGRDQTDRSNMVPMGQGNWNIPHGKYPEEHSGEMFVPKNYFTEEKTYEYKFDIDSTYNRDDAIQFCARYGMSQASKITFLSVYPPIS